MLRAGCGNRPSIFANLASETTDLFNLLGQMSMHCWELFNFLLAGNFMTVANLKAGLLKNVHFFICNNVFKELLLF